MLIVMSCDWAGFQTHWQTSAHSFSCCWLVIFCKEVFSDCCSSSALDWYWRAGSTSRVPFGKKGQPWNHSLYLREGTYILVHVCGRVGSPSSAVMIPECMNFRFTGPASLIFCGDTSLQVTTWGLDGAVNLVDPYWKLPPLHQGANDVILQILVLPDGLKIKIWSAWKSISTGFTMFRLVRLWNEIEGKTLDAWESLFQKLSVLSRSYCCWVPPARSPSRQGLRKILPMFNQARWWRNNNDIIRIDSDCSWICLFYILYIKGLHQYSPQFSCMHS